MAQSPFKHISTLKETTGPWNMAQFSIYKQQERVFRVSIFRLKRMDMTVSYPSIKDIS